MPSTKRKGILHNILGGSRKDKRNDVTGDDEDRSHKQKQPPPAASTRQVNSQQGSADQKTKTMSSAGPVFDFDHQTGLYTYHKKQENEQYHAPRNNKKNVKMDHGNQIMEHQNESCNNMSSSTSSSKKPSTSSNKTGQSSGHHHRVTGASSSVDENRTLRFAGQRGLATGDGEDITSRKGTVRGVHNRVRAGIANFEFKPLDTTKKKYYDDEKGSIIVYTTSTTIVRQTFDNCVKVKKLFGNHRVIYEERDLFVNPNHQRELSERMGEEDTSNLPIVFIDGELIGNIQQLEELNESGELSDILLRFEKRQNFDMCQRCGDRKYINCVVCNGSKKSTHRNGFTDQFRTLRCTQCDDNGLQKCPECYTKS
ncbi:glutaredoxin domain-containing cysteine-rich protein 1-like [Antedon mediterranea]|uniref:glutaredoxin domain-containing cysteine-rich protein 1-like n=1 Tax=Antedon mediterranea TaxID=105859 RepID=UPI003AF4B6C5